VNKMRASHTPKQNRNRNLTWLRLRRMTALCSATARRWWLTACCAVDEGAQVVAAAANDAAKAPRVKKAATSVSIAASSCVAAVLGDAERRMTIMGGREGFARALGSVYAGSVTRFLGGSIRRGAVNTAHSVLIPEVAASFGSLAVTGDGGHILVPTCASVLAVDRADPCRSRNVITFGCGPMRIVSPASVCVAPDGVAFVAEWATARVQVLTPQLEYAASLRSEVKDYRFPYTVCANEHFVAVANSSASVLLFSRATGKSVRAFDCSALVNRPNSICFVKTIAPTVAVSDGQRRKAIVMCLEATAPRCVRRLGHDDMFYPSSLACSDAGELVVSCIFRHAASICIFDALGDLCMTLRCNVDCVPGVCIHAGAIFTNTSLDSRCALLEVYD
jgi:hypothetical protein